MYPTVVALVHHRWGKASDRNGGSEENIVNMINVDINGNDVGGEDWGPCSPAKPRGCVACVVWRARTYLALMLVWGGPELTSGRN